MQKIIKQAWKTKDGKVLMPKDFGDTHLLNTIKFIENKCVAHHEEELNACMSVSFQGEMAQMHQDQFITHSKPSDYYPPIYYDLIDEAVSRNLIPNEDAKDN